MPYLPDDIVRHIAKRDPRAAVKWAMAGHDDSRDIARGARAAAIRTGKVWRAKSSGLDVVRTAINDIMRTRVLEVRRPTPQVTQALARGGFLPLADVDSYTKGYGQYQAYIYFAITHHFVYATFVIFKFPRAGVYEGRPTWSITAFCTSYGVYVTSDGRVPADVDSYVREIAPRVFGR